MVSLRRILSDFILFRREYLRNRTGFFFALIFPIILVLIFGAIFSGGSSGPVTAYGQNQDGGAISIAFMNTVNSTGAVRLTHIPNNISMSQYLLTHSRSIGILIPPNSSSSFINGLPINITMYSNPSDTSSQVVSSVTNGVINTFNLKRADASAVIGMQLQTISSQPNYKYIDFLIPGLIGFSILTSPMFSMVNISSEYKKTKLFKQLSLTPLTKGEWLASKIMWYVTLYTFLHSNVRSRHSRVWSACHNNNLDNSFPPSRTSVLCFSWHVCCIGDKECRVGWRCGKHHNVSDDVFVGDFFPGEPYAKLLAECRQSAPFVLPD